jgi:hypothetical protein
VNLVAPTIILKALLVIEPKHLEKGYNCTELER